MEANAPAVAVLLGIGLVIGFIVGSLTTKRPLFHNGQLGDNLRGKYQKWACGLTVGDCNTLLWLVGEYSCRAPVIFSFLDSCEEQEQSADDYMYRRAKLALEGIARLGAGDKVKLSRVLKDIRALKES